LATDFRANLNFTRQDYTKITPSRDLVSDRNMLIKGSMPATRKRRRWQQDRLSERYAR
jgi:hypothetical protein